MSRVQRAMKIARRHSRCNEVTAKVSPNISCQKLNEIRDFSCTVQCAISPKSLRRLCNQNHSSGHRQENLSLILSMLWQAFLIFKNNWYFELVTDRVKFSCCMCSYVFVSIFVLIWTAGTVTLLWIDCVLRLMFGQNDLRGRVLTCIQKCTVLLVLTVSLMVPLKNLWSMQYWFVFDLSRRLNKK